MKKIDKLNNQFESVRHGVTYKSHTQDHTFYTTINSDKDGKVIEMFVSLDDKDLFEMMTLCTRLVSMSLRAGVDPMTIAQELKGVSSPVTSHMIPRTDIMCPSIVARIGYILEKHINDNKGVK